MSLIMPTTPPDYEETLWQGSDRLYVLFGGMIGSIGLPTFNFLSNADILDQSHLFIRDPHRAWYQRGVPSIGDDLHAIARHVENRIVASGAKEVRFVGNCMGGFPALLLCALLGRGRAILFAPQTYLSPEKQREHGDTRKPDLIEDMYRHRTPSHIYDLQPWLRQHSPEISADLYVCADHTFDMSHASELVGFKNIRITTLENGGHRVVAQLNKQGLLRSVLAR